MPLTPDKIAAVYEQALQLCGGDERRALKLLSAAIALYLATADDERSEPDGHRNRV